MQGVQIGAGVLRPLAPLTLTTVVVILTQTTTKTEKYRRRDENYDENVSDDNDDNEISTPCVQRFDIPKITEHINQHFAF